jgi:hypothetical protein
MKAAKIVVMATVMFALAGVCAQAQEIANLAKIKGTITSLDSNGKLTKNKFGNAEIEDLLGGVDIVVNTTIFDVDTTGDLIDEDVFTVDAGGGFVSELMYTVGNSSNVFTGCAISEKSSGSKSSIKGTCVELISLFNSGAVDGAATCTISGSETESSIKFKKSCHVEAIVPAIGSEFDGLPIEFTVKTGNNLGS